MAAILLACHNVAKVVVYRRTIPLKATFTVLVLTMVGAAIGAELLARAPEALVSAAVIVAIALTFILERVEFNWIRATLGPVFAFCAAATSGFSGTSGPLKGIALRSLGLDRLYFVGAASLVSLGGDAVKAAIYTNAGLLDYQAWIIVLAVIP